MEEVREENQELGIPMRLPQTSGSEAAEAAVGGGPIAEEELGQ